MPGFDGAGPRGKGPMIGCGERYCAGYNAPGYANPVPRMGMGWRHDWGGAWCGCWGRGRGWRHMDYATGLPGWARFGYAPAWDAPPDGGCAPYRAPLAPEQEAEFLRAQADWLKQQVERSSTLQEFDEETSLPPWGNP